jgi:hypothetical protein
MDTQHFSQGTRFFWQGGEYEVRQLLPENKVTIENQSSGKAQVVALSTLLRPFHHAELLIQHDDETAQAATGQEALERVEIDYTPIDVMVVGQNDHAGDKLRPMYLLDRATRYIIGFSIEVERSDYAQQ